MKRLLPLILAALCLCIAAPAAYATDNVYELPELNMTIEAPEGWVVFMRDVANDDPNLELLGMDSKELADYYKENSIYLSIINPDLYAEIVITMAEDDSSRDVYDLNLIPEAEMQPQAELLMNEIQDLMKGQVTYSDFSVYKHKQATFAIFHLSQQVNGSTVYGKEYSTVINGMAINVTLHSYAGEISGGLSQTLQNTIDSIVFTKVTTKPSTSRSGGVLRSAGIGAVSGGIVAMILYFIRKGRKNKNFPPAGTDAQPPFGPGNTNM